jgi:CRP/FNR family cyclic AMP-dependent transcriptional regulator
VNDALKNVTIFAGLDDSALTLLMERAERITVPTGAVVVREGEPGNQFYLIASGAVRVCKRFDRSDEVELAHLKAGDFFGEMCILETLARSATVQSVADTVLFILTPMAFHDLFKAMPAQHSILLLNIARDLSRRLRRLDEIFAARS